MLIPHAAMRLPCSLYLQHVAAQELWDILPEGSEYTHQPPGFIS